MVGWAAELDAHYTQLANQNQVLAQQMTEVKHELSVKTESLTKALQTQLRRTVRELKHENVDLVTDLHTRTGEAHQLEEECARITSVNQNLVDELNQELLEMKALVAKCTEDTNAVQADKQELLKHNFHLKTLVSKFAKIRRTALSEEQSLEAGVRQKQLV